MAYIKLDIKDGEVLTAADLAHIESGIAAINNEDEIKSYIANELAKRKQLKPEFVNSIEECVDTDKIYVLPDGYIYAYTGTTTLIPKFTNKFPSLIDADDTLYNNGQGWKTNTRLSSSGVEKTQANVECTGYIPVSFGDVIYLGNMICWNGGTDDSGNSYEYHEYTYFSVYDKDKNHLGSALAGYFTQNNNAIVLAGDQGSHAKGNVIQINTENLVYGYTSATPDLRFEDMAFFRISCEEITADSIITVNEPIEYVEQKVDFAWVNTGHSFVSAENINGEININIDNNIEFANSIDECVDVNKLYVLSDGYIYAYTQHTGKTFKNALLTAEDENGNLFNNGLGYDIGFRFNSTGNLTESANSAYTGFIPYDKKSTIRIFGLPSADMSSKYIYFYDETKQRISTNSGFSLDSLVSTYGATCSEETIGDYTAYMLTMDLEAMAAVKDWPVNSFKNASYFRINIVNPNYDCFWISLGEEMNIGTAFQWVNTGHAFVTADKVDGKVNINVNDKVKFVNSIDECIDTEQLYVLPDGYIYSYKTIKEEGSFTNLIPLSIDAIDSTTIFNNGLGYQEGYRFNSSHQTVAANGQLITGYIPYTNQAVIRICGYNGTSPAGYIQHIKADGTIRNSVQIQQQFSNGVPTNNGLTYTADPLTPSSYMLTITPSLCTDSVMKYELNDGLTAFIRVNISGYTLNGLKLTLNEEINKTTEKITWANTGCAFVPVDYEDQILDLEAKVENHGDRIDRLEDMTFTNSTDTDIPNYVKEEAENVIDKVISAQGNRTFTMAAITDTHYETGNYIDGILHMSQALNYISNRIKLDAFAVLGDYVSNYPSNDYADSMDDFQDVNNLINNLRIASNLRLQGNHDFVNAKSPIVYRYVQSFSDNVTWGDRLGGYYYKDFEDYKIRVIALNMMESTVTGSSGSGQAWSIEQINWLIQSLDLTNKSDVSDWQILLISHHPLDWYYAGYTNGDNTSVIIPYILEAYKNGEAWSHNRLPISCNFTNKNQATLIGNIHGHIHNLMVEYLYLNVGNLTKSNVLRIATPEACIGRANNSYTGSVWEDSVTYAKTVGTVNDTSFCIYCIDLDDHSIKAICYGAGEDRVINY